MPKRNSPIGKMPLASMSSGSAPAGTVFVARRGVLRALAGAAALTLAPITPRGGAGAAMAQAEPARPVGVRVRNQTTGPSCQGPENVALTLVSPEVRRLRVEARHPAYIHALAAEGSVPAYLGCALQNRPAPEAAPPAGRRITLYETPEIAVVGLAPVDSSSPAALPFRVGGEAAQGIEKVELWMKPAQRGATVIELSLSDGSWRLRPLPPPALESTAFSAAVLLGPVMQEERLTVKLKGGDFDPATRTFTLVFSDGGSARVRLAGLDADALALDVAFTRGMSAPFAALRAHYAVESEADITRVAWRGASGAPFGEAPVMAFTDAADVALLWAGRLAPARPAPSAPDLVFTGFAGA